MRLRDFGFTRVLQYFAGRLTSKRPQRTANFSLFGKRKKWRLESVDRPRYFARTLSYT